jgi:hypothetical protein
MPFSFLAPAMLAALAVLAVPVLVHLIQKERKDAVRFPSLMFLSQVPYKSTRRRKIRNWALFLLRSAAVFLVVMAFSRPWYEGNLVADSPLASAREVAILIDRSYSMGYSGRWDRALAAANGAIDGLGPDDRASIIFFDGGAVSANQPTGDHARLKAALQGAQAGSGVTRYGPGLKLAQGVLETSDKPKREIILISDFQRAGWDGGEGVQLPSGTEITPVSVADGATSDVAVGEVAFRREESGGRDRVTATARIINTGVDPISNVDVTLELGGRDLETKTVNIPANDAISIVFSPFTLPEESVRGVVSIEPDALPADDRFHFLLSPGQAVNVLIADGGAPRSSLYLERALTISERPRYRVEVKRANAVRASDFTDKAVVIWNDAAMPPGETGRRLRTFVEEGGGLVLVAGPRANWTAAGDLIPGTMGQVAEREHPGGALGYIDYGHVVFEVFRAPRSGDLASARFFRYRPIQVDSTALVRARFDNGAAALIEKAVGAGRVMVFSSTLDNFWNDLPVQPIFLPLVHQIVLHTAGYVEPSPWFRVGQVIDVAGGSPVATADSAAGRPAPRATAELVALAPGGERIEIDTGLLHAEQRGFYEIRGEGAQERVVAVNVDLAESELASMDPQELVTALEPGESAGRNVGDARIRPADRERTQKLWWYLLIVAFLVLAAETVLGNRLSRRRLAR